MKTNLKDLEVLRKYLSEEELKEVAREVAYGTFKNSLGSGNPYNADNIEYYIKQGAYESVKQHITEGGFKEEEFVEELREKVKSIIKSISFYQIPLKEVIKEVVAEKREEVKAKVDEVWKDWINKDDSNIDSLYSTVSRSGAEYISEYIIDTFESSLKEKFKDK